MAIPQTDAGRILVAEMTGDWRLFPEWLVLDNRQRIIWESTKELLQILLCMTTAAGESGWRACHVSLGAILAENPFSLWSMSPLLQQYVASLPLGAPLRKAGECMIEELISTLPRSRPGS